MGRSSGALRETLEEEDLVLRRPHPRGAGENKNLSRHQLFIRECERLFYSRSGREPSREDLAKFIRDGVLCSERDYLSIAEQVNTILACTEKRPLPVRDSPADKLAVWKSVKAELEREKNSANHIAERNMACETMETAARNAGAPAPSSGGNRKRRRTAAPNRARAAARAAAAAHARLGLEDSDEDDMDLGLAGDDDSEYHATHRRRLPSAPARRSQRPVRPVDRYADTIDIDQLSEFDEEDEEETGDVHHRQHEHEQERWAGNDASHCPMSTSSTDHLVRIVSESPDSSAESDGSLEGEDATTVNVHLPVLSSHHRRPKSHHHNKSHLHQKKKQQLLQQQQQRQHKVKVKVSRKNRRSTVTVVGVPPERYELEAQDDNTSLASLERQPRDSPMLHRSASDDLFDDLLFSPDMYSTDDTDMDFSFPEDDVHPHHWSVPHPMMVPAVPQPQLSSDVDSMNDSLVMDGVSGDDLPQLQIRLSSTPARADVTFFDVVRPDDGNGTPSLSRAINLDDLNRQQAAAAPTAEPRRLFHTPTATTQQQSRANIAAAFSISFFEALMTPEPAQDTNTAAVFALPEAQAASHHEMDLFNFNQPDHQQQQQQQADQWLVPS